MLCFKHHLVLCYDEEVLTLFISLAKFDFSQVKLAWSVVAIVSWHIVTFTM